MFSPIAATAIYCLYRHQFLRVAAVIVLHNPRRRSGCWNTLSEACPLASPNLKNDRDRGQSPGNLTVAILTVESASLLLETAAGLPVVSSPIRTVLDFAEDVAIASSLDEWLAGIVAALSQTDPKTVNRRQELARDHDWTKITADVWGLIGSGLEAVDRGSVD